MKTLRAKLFFSGGIIFLIFAFLNYLLPEICIQKELSKAATHLNAANAKNDEKIKQFSSFLISYRLIKGVTELDQAWQGMPAWKEGSPWIFATTVMALNPQIAFIQLKNHNAYATISADAPLYAVSGVPPLLSIEGKSYKTLPLKDDPSFFLLYPETEKNSNQPIDIKTLSPTYKATQNSLEELFEETLATERRWEKRISLMQKLALLKESDNPPAGCLKEGICLLSNDVFSTISKPLAPPSTDPIPPFVLRGKDLCMVRFSEEVGIGFSISSIVKSIGSLFGYPITVSWDNHSLGFLPSGDFFDPQNPPKDTLPFTIDLKSLTLTLLQPRAEAEATAHFLENLHTQILKQITLSLLATTAFSFFLAIILLNRFSQHITEPIGLLSTAAQELGSGKYEALVLPQLGTRKDEVAILTHAFENMVKELQDRDKTHAVLNKVVSKEISNEILNHSLELGGEERILTLFFSDIRGFTHLSEKIPPKTLITYLNRYMTRMCHIVDETHGVVDKFVGDEIMALYGAPLPLENHAIHAIEAAILMMNELKEKKEEPFFEIGIGIHTGSVCIGNMGAENRLNYTVIGANVNLASRLCSIAKPMQILISEQTYQVKGVQEKFRCQPLPKVALKGIDEPVTVYEVSRFTSRL